jgi:hypothetical protein
MENPNAQPGKPAKAGKWNKAGKPGKAGKQGKVAKPAVAGDQPETEGKTAKTSSVPVTFSLQRKVRERLAGQARAEGLDLGHYLQKVLEAHIVATSGADDPLAERLEAKRAVIDGIVALASKLDADGHFDEHFVLTVMKEAAADPDFDVLYARATGGTGKHAMRQRKVLNQQLGRVIRGAARAKGKRTEDGGVARAQVKGEIIRTYTLLTRD